MEEGLGERERGWGCKSQGESCKVVVSKAINYEVYLHESSLAAALPNTDSQSG